MGGEHSTYVKLGDLLVYRKAVEMSDEEVVCSKKLFALPLQGGADTK